MSSGPAEPSPTNPVAPRGGDVRPAPPPGDVSLPDEGALRVRVPDTSSPQTSPSTSGTWPTGDGRSDPTSTRNGPLPPRPRTVRGPFSGFILAVAVIAVVIAAGWGLVTNRQ